jgi:hypothetical protein
MVRRLTRLDLPLGLAQTAYQTAVTRMNAITVLL